MAAKPAVPTIEVSASTLHAGDSIVRGDARRVTRDHIVVLSADPWTEVRTVTVPTPGGPLVVKVSTLWLLSEPVGGNPYHPGKPLFMEQVDGGNGVTLVRVPA